MHIIHFFCPGRPDATTVQRYEQAIAPTGGRLVWHNASGLSSVFVAMAQQWRDSGGRCVPRLRAATGMDPGDTLSLVAFSAGYGAVRELLRHEDDRAEVAAVVLLDALHDESDGAGRATGRNLDTFAAYAARAKTDPAALLWVGHSDVPTAGYASTTASAAKLLEMTGGQGGRFVVRAFDVRPASQAQAEHAQALIGWGPKFVGDALSGLRIIPVPKATDRPNNIRQVRQSEQRSVLQIAGKIIPWRDPAMSIGQRAVLWSVAQVALGNLETSGRNAGPVIAGYFDGATRRNPATGREQFVGIRSGEWCVVALCEAEDQTRLPGEARVLIQRVAGWEIVRDAKEAGTWVSAENIRAGQYVPQIGDAGVMVRPSGADPAAVNTRHVYRFATSVAGNGSYTSIDGNSGHDGRRWATNRRNVADRDFLGCVRHPQLATVPAPDVWAESVRASAEVVMGRDGLDYALAGLLPIR